MRRNDERSGSPFQSPSGFIRFTVVPGFFANSIPGSFSAILMIISRRAIFKFARESRNIKQVYKTAESAQKCRKCTKVQKVQKVYKSVQKCRKCSVIWRRLARTIFLIQQSNSY